MKRIQCDVAVVGGGVFGLASALELARRGRAVVVLDRFGPGHPATSSTGASRSIRTAYGDPFYVALARDALERWAALEAETGLEILHLTGQVDIGYEPSRTAIAEAVEATGAAIEARTNAELRELLPELAPDAGDGLFHREAGTVLAQAGMRALRFAALQAGVDLLAPERVTAIEGALVRTDGHLVDADTVVIAAGPWTGDLLGPLGITVPLAPAVAQVTFLEAPAMVDRPGVVEWPVPGAVGIYGHPVPGVGYKIAFDAGSEGWAPDVEEWPPDPDEERRIIEWLRRRMPGAPRRVAYSQRHPWTMTPDLGLGDRPPRSGGAGVRMLRPRVQVRPRAGPARRRRGRGRRSAGAVCTPPMRPSAHGVGARSDQPLTIEGRKPPLRPSCACPDNWARRLPRRWKGVGAHVQRNREVPWPTRPNDRRVSNTRGCRARRGQARRVEWPGRRATRGRRGSRGGERRPGR